MHVFKTTRRETIFSVSHGLGAYQPRHQGCKAGAKKVFHFLLVR